MSVWGKEKKIMWGGGRKGKKIRFKSFIKYYLMTQAKSCTPERRLLPWRSPEQARGHHTEEEAASLETEALLV